MSLVVNHNLMAANVARNLNRHYGNLSTSTQRLSTGLRVNSAADDAAGLAIRELQRADIAALHQGARNANDAISMIQVADGALSVIDEKLIRMKELAEQAATGTYDSTQRLMIESEYQAMASEITRISNATDFNGIHLLDGSLAGPHDGSGLESTGKMKIHFGTGNDSAEDYYYVEIGCATAEALGLGNNAYINPLKDPRIFSLEYYEKLRDESGQAAFDLTYKNKYEEYFKSIYTKLTTGTPVSEAIPASQASIEANKIAQTLATEFAETDRQMAKAAMDKVFNDEYLEPYLSAYAENMSKGMSHEEAQAAADSIAAKKAIEKLYEINNTVVSENSVTPYLDAAALPPKNSEGVAAIISEGETLAYNSAYNQIYDRLFEDGIEKALAETEITGIDETEAKLTPKKKILTASQILAIHEGVKKAADAQAQKVASKAKDSLQEIYETAYGLKDDSGKTLFQKYYDEALNAGKPESVASKIAEEKATTEIWPTLQQALLNPPSGWLTSLSPDDLSSTAEIGIPTSLPSYEEFEQLLDEITVDSGTASTKSDFDALLSNLITTLVGGNASSQAYSTATSSALSTMESMVSSRLFTRFLEDIKKNEQYQALSNDEKSTVQNELNKQINDQVSEIKNKITDDLKKSGSLQGFKDCFYEGKIIAQSTLTKDLFSIGDIKVGEITFNKDIFTKGSDNDVTETYQIVGTVGLNSLYGSSASTPLRDEISRYIESKRYNEILNKARNEGFITGDINEPNYGASANQVSQMSRVAVETAHAVAYTVTNALASEIYTIYANNYDGKTTDSLGYGHYKAENLANGMSEAAAHIDAMNKASRDAWNAVQVSLANFSLGKEGTLDSKYLGYKERTFLLDKGPQNGFTADAETNSSNLETGKAIAYQELGSLAVEKASTATTESLRDAVYLAIYNQRYQEAVNQVTEAKDSSGHLLFVPEPGGDPTKLTQKQVDAIDKACAATANSIANDVSEQVKAALQQVYDRSYQSTLANGSLTTDSGYNYYYNRNLEQGMTAEDAKNAAMKTIAERDAMNAVKQALLDAKLSSTPFGIDTAAADKPSNPVAIVATDGLLGHALHLSQFSYDTYEVVIPDVRDNPVSFVLKAGSGSPSFVDDAYKTVGEAGISFLNDPSNGKEHSFTVLAEYEGTQDDLDSVYHNIGAKADTWLNVDHAMNGGDEAMIAAAGCWCVPLRPTLQDGGTVSTQEAAQKAIVAINKAIESKDKIRADLGALQNRFENTITNLNTMAENLQAAESRISDVDVATEMTEFVRQQILTQSAVAMLAQANSLPQMAMQLIGG